MYRPVRRVHEDNGVLANGNDTRRRRKQETHVTTTGENLARYSTTIEPAPSRFTEPDDYAAWLQRAEDWAAGR